MKKIVIAILVVGLLVLGLWWTIRRRPGAVPPVEDNQTVFRAEAAERGSLHPLRRSPDAAAIPEVAAPSPGGIVVAQVVTQSDRQQICPLQGRDLPGQLSRPQTRGVRDGFFRLAELRDALRRGR